MLGRGVLSRLHCLTEQASFTLTMYVDIDQTSRANRNGGHLVQAEAMLKALRAEHPGDEELPGAVRTARALLEALEPQARTAVVVVHPGTGLAEVHQMQVALPARVLWRRGAFLRPVVEAMDEHERYAVVLTDQQRARVFTVFLGEISEHLGLVSDTSQRTRSTGADQWWSHSRFERRHEQEVASHARRVVEALQELQLRLPFDRLILAGSPDVARQVSRVLPTRLKGRLVDTVAMPITAAAADVLAGTLEVQRRIERQQEAELVEALEHELHDGGKAVAGLEPVIDAVNRGRIWKLVYRLGYVHSGGECRGCGAFSVVSNGPCALCGSTIEDVAGLVDRLSQATIDTGGQVEAIDGEAAHRLAAHGSIAALLRY